MELGALHLLEHTYTHEGYVSKCLSVGKVLSNSVTDIRKWLSSPNF